MTERPRGDIEIRSAETIGVSFPKRIIEVVAMPYDRETVVEYRGRAIRESVAPGAFDGIDRRPNRVSVNRDHNLERLVGRAVSFHPSRTEGLVAELRIAKTELGDETLNLAAEEMLDASAGFWPLARKDGSPGEEWPEKNLRRLTWLWLDHIAMTPDPAYQDARTLSVRSQAIPEESPGVVVRANLSEALALRRQDQYDLISR
jgi:phage head maturation protease